jgi:hypothetical protein
MLELIIVDLVEVGAFGLPHPGARNEIRFLLSPVAIFCSLRFLPQPAVATGAHAGMWNYQMNPLISW